MKLIESKTLASAAASIEFTSIPQTFTDLYLVVSGRFVESGGPDPSISADIVLNSAASDCNWRRLSGTGSSATSGTASSVTGIYIGEFPASNSTSNTFANTNIYIPNYKESTQKSVSVDSVSENNATTAAQTLVSGLCTKTAAITSLTIRAYAGGSFTLSIGSTISLYGILKGSDGIVTTS
jgi:hypothetical protein